MNENITLRWVKEPCGLMQQYVLYHNKEQVVWCSYDSAGYWSWELAEWTGKYGIGYLSAEEAMVEAQRCIFSFNDRVDFEESK